MCLRQVLLLVATATTVWCTDPKVVIRQTFPYTTSANNYKYIIVPKDTDIYMACVVDNIGPQNKVQWLAQHFNSESNIPISTDTDTQNAYKYQVDKPAANNWRLRVQNLLEEDQALYICRVQLGGQQSANDSRIIIVHQTPQIIDIRTSSDSTIEEGDRYTLECDAGGIPKPRISWQMAGGGTLPTGGRVLQQPKLLIPGAQMQHKGAYICTAENEAGKDTRRIYLNVKFYPRIKVASPEVFQAVGHPRTLMCEAEGNPVPKAGQLIWKKEGVPLIEGPKYRFENFTGSNFVLMKLRINEVNENDYGEYGCYAENSEGNGENFVRLLQSTNPVNDRTGVSGTSILSFSVVTLVMLVATSLLHFC